MKKQALGSRSASDPGFYVKKRAAEKRLGRKLSTAEFQRDFYEPPPPGAGMAGTNGVSIFDPVLAELVVRWFSPPGGLVLDPFAGGSVRGLVAAKCGRRYVGVDLRPEQVAANCEQAAAILSAADPEPVWVAGDSRGLPGVVGAAVPEAGADLLFSCPPYGDLEVYSDDPRDLSRAGWEEFLASYREIVERSLALLAADRFAVFVVGDFRDSKGCYRGFPWWTVDAFQRAGARLYNEAVLVTPLGSLPVIVSRQFSRARKLGKTHQNVLVFVKGDPRRAAAACGEVEVGPVAQESQSREERAESPGSFDAPGLPG